MAELSGNLLFLAFILYLISIVFFGGDIRQKKGFEESATKKKGKFGTIGIIITIIGFFAHIGYFITRWIAAGHPPVSNMFEFVTFFSIMFVGGFIILYILYRTNVLGLFTLPIVLIIIAYGSMFVRDITPLVPTLKSNWLVLHVMTVAAGEGILAISFIAGFIYLIKNINFREKGKKVFWLETVMFSLLAIVGFVLVNTSFSIADYHAEFSWVDKEGNEKIANYTMPPITGPNEGVLLTEGRMEPLFEMPPYINATKLNTLLWSLLAGTILYIAIRLITRKKVGELFQPFVQNMSNRILDEISYRSVLIGFPVFTLGGLVFAMMYAQIAWSRYWSWDPKEVWALITWLFYAAFLHLRLSRGWHGEKSAWLTLIGFAIIMFNLIFVNLVIAGLHSYA